MANTRSAAKRARQSEKRRERNQSVKSLTKSAIKKALTAITAKNLDEAKVAYAEAIKKLDKAVTKGIIPQRRASRKISRLTLLALKTLPEALPFSTKQK